ncbi:MAG: imidazole glycerol phosphate synthase subunit HisH [Thermoanaerobaculia bacterium]|nr:imidazole glycerol phosphate synthase subunit HisH [Thermoanaerobaculia bacterium]
MQTTIIDAGVGNLGNLERALRSLGADTLITSDPDDIRSGTCLVLPGVGAFRPPREVLRGEREAALRQALAAGAHLLGVCIGFQLLFASSREFGTTDGLELLGGEVAPLPDTVELPHMGWNRIHDLQPHPLLAGLDDGAYFYFVHSFAPTHVPEASVLALCTHGRAFPAICASGRVAGTQFHPEKSGASGLRLLSNFLETCHGTAAGD